MDTPPPEPTANGTPGDWRTTAPTRGFAVASVSLGFFSMIVFFWYPFGLLLASVGFVLGFGSWLLGIRGGLRGENLALMGAGLCAFSITVILTLTQGLRFIQWDH